MVRPAPTLAKNSMGAKCPLAAIAAFAIFTFLVFTALAALAATAKAVFAARAALTCRDLITVSTRLRLLLSNGQMCALLSTLHNLCVLSDRCPIWEFSYKSALSESSAERLQFGDGFDGPLPFDRAKTLVDDGRRENGLWPVSARDADCPHGTYISFLADVVLARA